MSFFDEEYMALPNDGQYYFNVLVFCIGIHPRKADEYLGVGVDEITYIDEINDARPRAFFFFVDDTLPDDTPFQVEKYPHSVVEVSDQLGVSWYDMLDFEPDDPWRIE